LFFILFLFELYLLNEKRSAASATDLLLNIFDFVYTQVCVPYDREGNRKRHQYVFTKIVFISFFVITAANI